VPGDFAGGVGQAEPRRRGHSQVFFMYRVDAWLWVADLSTSLSHGLARVCARRATSAPGTKTMRRSLSVSDLVHVHAAPARLHAYRRRAHAHALVPGHYERRQ
jgi:hypothetical protein